GGVRYLKARLIRGVGQLAEGGQHRLDPSAVDAEGEQGIVDDLAGAFDPDREVDAPAPEPSLDRATQGVLGRDPEGLADLDLEEAGVDRPDLDPNPDPALGPRAIR